MTNQMADPYATLGVPRSATATQLREWAEQPLEVGAERLLE